MKERILKELEPCMLHRERLAQRMEALRLELGQNGHRGVFILSRLTLKDTRTRKGAQVVLGCKLAWEPREDITKHAELEWKQL